MSVRGLIVAVVYVAGTFAAAAQGSFQVVASSNRGNLSNLFNGVAAVSSSEAWAVGHWYDESLASYRTLIQRWNGSRWSIVPTPNVGAGYNDLFGVVALGGDAWAVGYSRASQYGARRALVLHWDGVAWRASALPSLVDGDSQLYAVGGAARDDVWAVGTSLGHSLSLHWNGARWSVVPSPTGTNYTSLTAVAALGPADAWVGGQTYSRTGKRYVTFLQHWDGAQWTVVPSPNQTGANAIRGMAAIDSNDVWVVGAAQGSPLAMHWDGTRWQLAASPQSSAGQVRLWSVTAPGPNDVWAIGYTYGIGSGIAPLVAHWNGSGWTTTPAPAVGINPSLYGVAHDADGNVLAVGVTSDGTADRTFALKSGS